MPANTSAAHQAEVLAIRRRLADAVQALGWYTGDLDDLNTAGVARLPGMGQAAQAHLDRHRQRVIRLTDAAREYREEAREALSRLGPVPAHPRGGFHHRLQKAAPGLLPSEVIEGGGSHETWPPISISTTTRLRAVVNGSRPRRRATGPVGP